MLPEIDIFGRTLTYYTIAVCIGALTVVFFAMWAANKYGHDYYRMLCTMFVSFIGVGVGGSLLYGIVNFNLIIKFFQTLDSIDSFDRLVYRLGQIFGGSVFYGGMIGCVLMSLLFLKISQKKFGDAKEPYLDMGAFCIPLFHFFGRIGCFLSGCCYGIECKFGLAYHYSQLESANGPTRFPVQLCEAIFNLILFFVIYNMFKKGILKNKLMAFYLLVYPIGRFLLEFLRGDAHRGFVIGWVSTSQFISIILIIISSTYLIVKRNSNRSTVADNK